MGSITKLFSVLLTVAAIASSSSSEGRPLQPHPSLRARLKMDVSSKCWDSLLQLQSCSGEIVMFFLYGETYMGRDCCEAVEVIQHECWPALLGSLGLTPEEGDVLGNYCDSTDHSLPPLPLSPTPLAQNIEFSELGN